MRCGNDYGGFDVYPEILKEQKSVVYSFGIGEDLSFSEDILRNFSSDIYAFDPTPKAIQYVKRNPIYYNEHFHVLPYALSDRDTKLDFALPQSDGWISGSAADVKQDSRNFDFDRKIQVEGRTIESIMKELGHNRIDLLKMDIEGSEFDVLEETLNKKLNIIEMCVDHHGYMLKHGRKRMISLLSHIKENYDIICTEDDGNKNFCCIRKEVRG